MLLKRKIAKVRKTIEESMLKNKNESKLSKSIARQLSFLEEMDLTHEEQKKALLLMKENLEEIKEAERKKEVETLLNHINKIIKVNDNIIRIINNVKKKLGLVENKILPKKKFLTECQNFLKLKGKITGKTESIINNISLHKFKEIEDLKNKGLKERIKLLAEILEMPFIEFKLNKPLPEKEIERLKEKADYEIEKFSELWKKSNKNTEENYYYLMKDAYYKTLLKRLNKGY